MCHCGGRPGSPPDRRSIRSVGERGPSISRPTSPSSKRFSRGSPPRKTAADGAPIRSSARCPAPPGSGGHTCTQTIIFGSSAAEDGVMQPPIHRWDVFAPRACVHVVHGMAEHGARYERFGRALNTADISVWAHDHRGHGANPTPGLMGHFADANGWRAVLDDVRAVSREMARTFPGVPLLLFAHSMGSFMAHQLIAEDAAPYGGLVLSGTNGAPDVT